MTRAIIIAVVAVAGCKAHVGASPDASGDDAAIDDAAIDTPPESPLALTCAATASSFTPGPCPAATGSGASFCFRPQFPGVTSVDVYGGFPGNDWATPLVTLADDGTGTFTGTATLAVGTYPYLYRVHGGVDGLARDGQYLRDQQNPAFVKPPAGAPDNRSVSQLTIPQTSATLHHIRGEINYAGIPQSCFAISLAVGELRDDAGKLISERAVANVVESAPDGTFEFPVADGTQLMAVARFPFGLSDSYPDPHATPAIGYARTGFDMAGADVTLDAIDVSYPAADYAAMSPVTGTATIPTTFTFTVVPGSTDAAAAVIATNSAGNDPAYESTFVTDGSISWNGVFGNGKMEVNGTQYYWGAWQHRGIWTDESLLFPITFH